MKRSQVLLTANRLVSEDREAIHGDPVSSLEDVAALWQGYLGVPICGTDVALMMSLFKIGRIKQNPLHEDNWIDAAGYIAIGSETV